MIIRFPNATSSFQDYVRQERDRTRRKSLLAAIVAGIGLVLLLVATGCGSLEVGGAYNPATTNAAGQVISLPDKQFALVEASYALAFATVDGIFNYERENRSMLWALDPRIKHTLDEWRPQAVLARKQYHLARQAYLAHPTGAGLDNLKVVLSRISQVSDALTAVLPKP